MSESSEDKSSKPKKPKSRDKDKDGKDGQKSKNKSSSVIKGDDSKKNRSKAINQNLREVRKLSAFLPRLPFAFFPPV